MRQSDLGLRGEITKVTLNILPHLFLGVNHLKGGQRNFKSVIMTIVRILLKTGKKTWVFHIELLMRKMTPQ